MKNKNITQILTPEQYKNFCITYFIEKQNEINPEVTKIKNLSHEDYSIWQRNLYEDFHNVARNPIKNYVSFVRGDFNPLEDDNSEKDPLKIPSNQEKLNEYVAIYEGFINDFLKKNPFIIDKDRQLKEHITAVAEEKSMHVEVDGKKFRAIKKIPVLWAGWDSDSNAWIVEDEGQKKIVMSNHGSLYFAQRSELEGKLEEYRSALEQTQEAIGLLGNPKKPKP